MKTDTLEKVTAETRLDISDFDRWFAERSKTLKTSMTQRMDMLLVWIVSRRTLRKPGILPAIQLPPGLSADLRSDNPMGKEGSMVASARIGGNRSGRRAGKK
jgi:hypothetical protein